MLNKHVSNLLRFYKRYNNEISETRAELKLNEGIGKSITTPYSGNHGLIDGNLAYHTIWLKRMYFLLSWKPLKEPCKCSTKEELIAVLIAVK